MRLWDINYVQFVRLLAEVRAILGDEEFSFLEETMDLNSEEIEEIFVRADREWEAIKAALPNMYSEGV